MVPKALPSGPSGSQPLGVGQQGRPSGPAVLSLHARGLWVRPASQAGLIVRARATEIDHSPRRDSASGRWAACLDQPCRLDSASGCGPRGSTSRPVGTQPLSTVLRTRRRQPNEISLRARGRVDPPACPEGLSHRPLGSGQRESTSSPSGTQPFGKGAGPRPPVRQDSASVPGVCEFDQPAWRDSACGSGPP